MLQIKEVMTIYATLSFLFYIYRFILFLCSWHKSYILRLIFLHFTKYRVDNISLKNKTRLKKSRLLIEAVTADGKEQLRYRGLVLLLCETS